MDGRTGSQRWTSLFYFQSGEGGGGRTSSHIPLPHPLSSSPLPPPPPPLRPRYPSPKKGGWAGKGGRGAGGAGSLLAGGRNREMQSHLESRRDEDSAKEKKAPQK